MKKLITAVLLLVYTGTNAQKIPAYSGEISIGAQMGKTDSGTVEKNLNFKAEGVYGWFFYQLKRFQPFKKTAHPGLEKMTMISLGYGKNVSILNDDANLAWGFGPNMTMIPDTGFGKKVLVLWGGTIYGNAVSEEYGFDAEISITYNFLPKNTENDWNQSLFLPEVKLRKFFGSKKIKPGVGAEYRLVMFNASEPQIQGTAYKGTTFSDSRSEVSAFLCANIKGFGVEFGPVLTRTKNKMTDRTGLNTFDAKSWPTRWQLRFTYSFLNKGE